MDDIDTFLFLHRIDTMSHLVAQPLSDPSLEEEKNISMWRKRPNLLLHRVGLSAYN